MKKTFKLWLLAIVLSFTGNLLAQDMIVKKDGTIIKAKIAEVGEEVVKYKKADNPDGPIYSISKNNITAINYANGEVEKFATTESPKSDTPSESSGEDKSKSGSILDDEPMKRTLEGVAKDVGEQLMRSCANGKVDNATTEIYWDSVFRDAITGEITLPIVATWKPKWNEGNGKWIKGKIMIAKDGARKWVYQNDSGLLFSGCAKGFKIK